MTLKLKLADYHLFLFDMDGLLINTEGLHFEAYRRFLIKRGYTLPWSFEDYLQIAHTSSSSLKEAIYRLFPKLYEEQPKWAVLYEEKKKAFMEVLLGSDVEWMPGAQAFLTNLLELEVAIAVVTNSTKEQVRMLCSKQPLLSSITRWVVREDYEKAKPDPQCYKLAIDKWGFSGVRVVGFEDSARGLMALLGSASTSVLVTTYDYPQLAAYQGRFEQVRSFNEIDWV